MSTTTSASPAPPQAASTMARSSRRRGAKMPGVSMKTSWLSPSMAMPRIGMRVVCTLRLTIDTLAPTSALTSVDLPALGAPMTATKPQRVSGAAAACSAIRLAPPHAFAREQRGGSRLLGGALACALAARRLPARDAHLGGEARRVIGSLRARSPRSAAASGPGPAPIPAARTWHRRRRRACRRAWLPTVRAHDRRAPCRIPPRGRRRRAGPRRHRRGSCPCRGRRCRPRCRTRPGPAPRSSARATVGAGAAAHETVVAARKLAFAGGRIDLAQQLGDREPQHTIAQELQALVVAALGRGLAHAGMRQRPLEQGAVLEA